MIHWKDPLVVYLWYMCTPNSTFVAVLIQLCDLLLICFQFNSYTCSTFKFWGPRQWFHLLETALRSWDTLLTQLCNLFRLGFWFCCWPTCWLVRLTPVTVCTWDLSVSWYTFDTALWYTFYFCFYLVLDPLLDLWGLHQWDNVLQTVHDIHLLQLGGLLFTYDLMQVQFWSHVSIKHMHLKPVSSKHMYLKVATCKFQTYVLEISKHM